MTTRPPRSLPRTRVKSIPSSPASLRTEGAAATCASGFAGACPLDSSPGSSSTGLSCFGPGAASARFSFFAPASAPPASIDRITWPTDTLSPSLTRIFVTVPEVVEGIGATAFSFSSSRIVWPSLIGSPSFTRRLTTTPESAPSPSFGSFTSIEFSRFLKKARPAATARRES